MDPNRPTTRRVNRNGIWSQLIELPAIRLEIVVGETEVTARPARERFAAFEEPRDRLGPLVGDSAAMRQIYATIEAAAPTPVTIMVTGESGTGKELAAQAIHQLSGRKGRLVTFDCAGTSPELIRSELFGHRRGAFTGADAEREAFPGR